MIMCPTPLYHPPNAKLGWFGSSAACALAGRWPDCERHNWEKWNDKEESRFNKLYKCSNCRWIVQGEWIHPEKPYKTWKPEKLDLPHRGL